MTLDKRIILFIVLASSRGVVANSLIQSLMISYSEAPSVRAFCARKNAIPLFLRALSKAVLILTRVSFLSSEIK